MDSQSLTADQLADLYTNYRKISFGIAFKLLRTTGVALDEVREMAQDVVQNIFLKLYTSGVAMDYIQNPEAYIAICSRNITLKFIREMWTRRHHDTEYSKIIGVYDTATTELELEQVNKMFKEVLEVVAPVLPDSQRAILVLKKEGFTLAEIAKVTNTTVYTVSNHIKALRKNLERYKELINEIVAE